MARAFKRTVKKAWRRNKRKVLTVLFVALLLLLTAFVTHQIDMKQRIDPSAYKPLLNLIARAESNGNYEAYFSHPENTTISFTAMSIADVLRWQESFVQQGSPSSAVGRYQFLNTTLSGLVQKLKIDPAQKFDQPMQDRLAVALLEKRGAASYMNGTLNQQTFAANLAKEWAGLPKVIGDNPQASYYAGDGLNAARVPVSEVLTTIESVKPK